MKRELGVILLVCAVCAGAETTQLEVMNESRTFSEAIGYDITFVTNATLVLQGADNALGSLVGDATVSLEGAADGILELGSAASGFDGCFKGALSVADGKSLTLRKVGANAQTVTRPLTFEGSVVVASGTLRLGAIPSVLPSVSSAPSLAVDATDAASLTLDEAGRVSAWRSSGTAMGADFVQDDDAVKPTYDATALNGRPGLTFNGSAIDVTPWVTNRLCLADGMSVPFQSVYLSFLVRQPTKYGGIVGCQDEQDAGVRLTWRSSGATIAVDSAFTALTPTTGRPYAWQAESQTLNGTSVFQRGVNQPLVYGARLTNPLEQRLSLGHMVSSTDVNAFNGVIGEVLTYPEALSDIEDYLVTDHLMRKWVDAESEVAENVLPANVPVTIEKGAVLDLAGTHQTIAALTNYGSIINSASNEAVLTIESCVARGTIGGNIRVVRNTVYTQFEEGTRTFTEDFDYGAVYATNGTLVLQGSDNVLGALVGTTPIVVQADDSILTIGSDDRPHDGVYRGTITAPATGRLTLVKEGSNGQTLAAPLSFSGAVVVKAGTLRLGAREIALPSVSSAPSLAVDATDAASLELDETGRVSAWRSSGTAMGADFVQDDDAVKPTYDATALSGRPGLVFNGSERDVTPWVTNRLCLADGMSVPFQSVYLSFQAHKHIRYDGLIGAKDTMDAGVRLSSVSKTGVFTLQAAYAALNGKAVRWDSPITNQFMNGTQSFTGNLDVPYVYGARLNDQKSQCLSLGHMVSSTDVNAFNGVIGEVLTYPEALSDIEDYLVTDYLMRKWVDAEAESTENVLPADASVTIEEGAVLDLAGCDQTLANVVNRGMITNSSSRTVLLTVKHLRGKGVLAANVDLKRTAGIIVIIR